jgi:outer membrane protein assembly factor BamB
MTVVRLTITALLLLPALALAQDKKEDEAKKVSNDRPDRPLQMPPASSEVKEAFEDFERFARRGAWERALKSLYGIPESQARRFVDGRNGFIIPVARKRRDLLAALPPEGQVAHRLFYDDEAKKLLDQADGASELRTLERLYSAYFPTSVGDNAADRLGDLYFEMGRFDRAADCWLAILRDRPDTDLSPALVSVKAALALSRAGRGAELAALRRDVADRYASERVSVGGRTAPASEHLQRLVADNPSEPAAGGTDSSTSAEAPEPRPDLPQAAHAVWQLRFAEYVTAGMTPPERVQWESNPLSGAVPAVAVDGTRLYANYLGYVFAMDLRSGKLLWRSAPFHNVETPASQDQARVINASRYAVVASKDYVWSLSRDLKEPNQVAPFRLACRRADGGDVVWQSTDLPDYAQLDLVGHPLFAGGTLFVVGKTLMMNYQGNLAHQYVLAVRPRDGKVLWKAEVGMFRESRRFFYYGMGDNSPLPRLYHQGGAVYVDTHAGILARVDAESGEVEWGYGYQTEPVQGDRFFFFYGMDEPKEHSASSVPLRSGEALFVKGAKSEKLYALDPDRMALLWDRPLAESARLLGADDRAVFLGGPEISALDRHTRALLWATRVPGGSKEGRLFVRHDGLWQLTPRGIFEIDPRSGRVRRILRGDDTGSDGGDLYPIGRWLVAVSNRTISAYPIAADAAGAAGGVGGGGRAAAKTGASDE